MEQKDRIIRSKNIAEALRTKVSQHQVEELTQEYKELEDIFKNLSDKVGGSSPMNETALIGAIRILNFPNPLEIIDKLKDIGLLKDYKPAKNKDGNDEKRYHIPDLYLHGLKFIRQGPN